MYSYKYIFEGARIWPEYANMTENTLKVQCYNAVRETVIAKNVLTVYIDFFFSPFPANIVKWFAVYDLYCSSPPATFWGVFLSSVFIQWSKQSVTGVIFYRQPLSAHMLVRRDFTVILRGGGGGRRFIPAF